MRYQKLAVLALWRSALSQAAFVPASECRVAQRSGALVAKRFRSLSSTPSNDAEDTKKWERMYQEGELQTANFRSSFLSEEETMDKAKAQLGRASAIRVVTFDLDNTLWKTGAVIGAANDALALYLEDNDIKTPVRVEKIMGALFKENKSRYNPLSEDAHAPVKLTQLRKDAIQHVLEKYNDFSSERAEAFADDAFEVWTAARHDAIPDHFASSVLECFEQLQSLRTHSGERIVIGAITDGNSDPRRVEALRPYIDFCVQSERVGISKPDRRVYSAAVAEVASLPSLSDIFEGKEIVDDQLEELLGPWWVHVGDDFLKDIVPGNDLRMRTVWTRELLPPEKRKAAEPATASNPKERTVEDLVKEISSQRVTEMIVGSEDFLLDSIQKDFADAVADTFDKVGELLKNWHEEGLRMHASAGKEPTGEVYSEEITSKKVATQVTTHITIEEPPNTQANPSDSKFCIFCGTSLPSVAKFCSSCGGTQP